MKSENKTPEPLHDIEGNEIQLHDSVIIGKPFEPGFMLGSVKGWDYSKGEVITEVVVDGFSRVFRPISLNVLVRQPMREAPEVTAREYSIGDCKVREEFTTGRSPKLSKEEIDEIANIDLEPESNQSGLVDPITSIPIGANHTPTNKPNIPEEDGNGFWIEWTGGDLPTDDPEAFIEIETNSGNMILNQWQCIRRSRWNIRTEINPSGVRRYRMRPFVSANDDL